MSSDGMTKSEREELAKVARGRAKLAKEATKQRAAELTADVERQLAAIYKADDGRWRDVAAVAKQAIGVADAEIAKRCRELGIPEQFRPGLNLNWYNRGENASLERRTELRRVCITRITALEQRAKTVIERGSLDVQEKLALGGLDSAAAKAFLASMPTANELMPSFDVSEIEAAVPLPRSLSAAPTGGEIMAAFLAREAALDEG